MAIQNTLNSVFRGTSTSGYDFGTIVVSFVGSPGGSLRKAAGLRTI
jgi:hypothetical protein